MTTLRAALWLLRDVTLPSLRNHRLRAVLTLIGVAIGTQVVVAMAVVNRSVLASFQRTIETIAGPADLQVTNGSAGVPEDLIATVGRVPGIAEASGLVQGTLHTARGDLTVFGVDLLADQSIRTAQFPSEHVDIPDVVAFTNATDSIALSRPFAKLLGAGAGGRVEVAGPTGRTALTVRGSLDPVGVAALFGGAIGLVDLPTAQRLFERDGRVDQIDLRVAAGIDPGDLIAPLTEAVAGAGRVETPRSRGASLGTMLAGMQTILTLVSLNAIIVGVFLIYQTMNAAITHRRRELALARAVGYRQRTLVTAVGLEALVFGAAGSAVGIVAGLIGARLSLDAVSSAVSAIYAPIDRPPVTLLPADVVGAFLLGIASTLVSAVAPAREAAGLRILEQLRSSANVDAPRRPGGRAILPGLLLVGAGLLVFAADLRPGGSVAKVALIMSAVLLVSLGYTYLMPAATWLLVRPLASLAAQARGISPTLACERIARDPSRCRGTLAALMVAFSMVLIVGGFIQSLRGSILSWVDQVLAEDLHVSAGPQLDLPAGPTLSDAIEGDIRATPGVSEVSGARMLNVRVGDGVAVLRTETARALARQRYPIVASDGDHLAAFPRGDAVLVSDNFSYRHGFRAGDTLALETPSGRRAFRIGAVVVDYTLDIGSIIVDRDVYKRLWHDDLVNTFRVWLAPDADVGAVRAALSARLSPRIGVTILTSAQFRSGIQKALDDALRITYAIQLIAIAIAVIGVINFFLAEIVDRRREIGLLRSVALGRGQLVQALVTEASVIGLLGGVMAVLYAWPISFMLVTRSTRLVSGWRLTFDFPTLLAGVTVAVAALTSAMAAYLPAHSAARGRVADLVGME